MTPMNTDYTKEIDQILSGLVRDSFRAERHARKEKDYSSDDIKEAVDELISKPVRELQALLLKAEKSGGDKTFWEGYLSALEKELDWHTTVIGMGWQDPKDEPFFNAIGETIDHLKNRIKEVEATLKGGKCSCDLEEIIKYHAEGRDENCPIHGLEGQDE